MAATQERLAAPALRPRPLSPAGTRLVVTRMLAQAWHDRVLGMAAEAGFWALVSLPPLLLAMVGTLGNIVNAIDPGTTHTIEAHTLNAARKVLTTDSVNDTVKPLLDAILKSGHADAISVGFILSLWSGSTAMAAYVNTITIAYDLRDVRSAVRSRLVALWLYLAGVIVGIVVLPLLVVGPEIAAYIAPSGTADLAVTIAKIAYWPFTVCVVVALLASLYHFAIPVRTRWRRGLPGAAVAMLLWVVGSIGLRYYFSFIVDRSAAYASIAAPMAILLWFYVTALAVLLGAELNAERDRLWPAPPAAGHLVQEDQAAG